MASIATKADVQRYADGERAAELGGRVHVAESSVVVMIMRVLVLMTYARNLAPAVSRSTAYHSVNAITLQECQSKNLEGVITWLVRVIPMREALLPT